MTTQKMLKESKHRFIDAYMANGGNGRQAAAVAPVAPPVAGDANSVALALLDGKNLAEFFSAAIPDATVRADAAVNTAVMNGSFVESAKAANLITVDDNGVHHLV